jgi:hypothetical protein
MSVPERVLSQLAHVGLITPTLEESCRTMEFRESMFECFPPAETPDVAEQVAIFDATR